MLFDSRSARTVLWVVVLAVLTVRASDTHLHFCFDGQEPPTSVHFADASVHHDEHHETQDHADKDYDPLVGLLSKSVGTDSDVAPPIPVLVLVVLLPPASDTLPAASDPLLPAATSPLHLRPPLRGPPA
jgi:hypothetical protein